MNELPEGWEWKRLGDVGQYINGKAFKPSDWTTSGKPIVRIQNLTREESNFNFFQGVCEEKYLIKNGDILISWSASLGVFVWNGGDAVLNQHIFKAIPNEKLIDRKFLVYIVGSILEGMKKYSHGSTMKHIVKGDFDNSKIPLPPLPVQRQIVAVLEQAEVVKRQRQEADVLTGALLQSVFYEMFGDPVKNEKGWDIFPIGNICEGIVPGRNKPKTFGGDIPWITPVDLDSFFVSSSKQNLTINENEVKKCKNKIIPPNSVIMTCVGDFGITAITKNRVVLNQQLHAFVCTLSVNPFYLHFYLKLRMDYFQKMATKTTVNYLNKTKCNSIPVLLPPLALQQQFAHIVECVEALRERQKDSGEEIGGLLEGLMEKAFSGKIVAVEA
ncbi:MAG: restriction endonuclease subunit S [Methanoregula sp.]